MLSIKKIREKSRDVRGFTIIEALVALLILSFAVLGIFRIHLQAVKTTAFNKRMLAAVQFARSGIEDLRSQAYSALSTSSKNTDDATIKDFSDHKLYFVRDITISTVSGINKTKKAEVKVGWKAVDKCTGGVMSGCDHFVVLETYLTDLN